MILLILLGSFIASCTEEINTSEAIDFAKDPEGTIILDMSISKEKIDGRIYIENGQILRMLFMKLDIKKN